jgi:hypothetical protein
MDKQTEILRYMEGKEEVTLSEIYANISWSYYHNASKHLGCVLSSMVKNKKVQRIKPGVFKIRTKEPVLIDHPKLF